MDISTIIITTAKAVGVSPSLLLAICTVESANQGNIYVHDDKGTPSYGACQIKKAAAEHMIAVFKPKSLKNAADSDLRDQHKNIKVAALYLKYQLNRYDGNMCKAIAAYNAGSFLVSSTKKGEPKNAGYVNRVIKNLDAQNQLAVLISCAHNTLALE